MASTVYDIKLRYLLDDKASRGAAAISKTLHETSKSAMSLRSVLGGIAGAAAGVFGLRAAKSALIDFNAEMEQAKTTTAGMLMINLGGTFEQNIGGANKLVGELQERAKASTATTKEFVDFMTEVVNPLTQAGMKMSELSEFTANAVVAARAFGDENVAALDIQQALTSQVTLRDRFARKLLNVVKMTSDEFNKLDTAGRLETLKKAVGAPAILAMGKAQESSFKGVMSTFEDVMQITIGKIGVPLFKAITEEVKRWNAWIDSNGDLLARIGKDFGQTLVEGFQVVKSVMSFFVEHRDTLMMLAKMWIGAKLIGGATGGVRAAADAFAGLASKITNFGNVAAASATGMEKFGSLLSKGGLVVTGLTALYFAAQRFADWVDKRQSVDIQKRTVSDAFMPAAAKAIAQARSATTGADIAKNARNAAALMQSSGVYNRQSGQVDREALKSMLVSTSLRERMQIGKDLGLSGSIQGDIMPIMERMIVSMEKFASVALAPMKMFADSPLMTKVGPYAGAYGLPTDLPEAGRPKGKGKMEVTINKIEVQSDDPDRFVAGMATALADLARNPTSALGTFEER